MDWFERWTTLSALAVHSDQIVIGTIVSSMNLRNPALLARMALTVDHISGGRPELGVGAGGVPNCHKMTGIPHWEPRERSERYRESVEFIDQMLTNEIATYQGKYFDIQEADMRPGSISQPRLLFNVAAHGPKAIQLAARYGDALNSFYLGKDLTPVQISDITRQRCEEMCEIAIDAGRDPTQIGRTFCFSWTSDGLFRSMEAFYEALRRYREAGIKDLFFVYAPGFDSQKVQSITIRDQ